MIKNLSNEAYPEPEGHVSHNSKKPQPRLYKQFTQKIISF